MSFFQENKIPLAIIFAGIIIALAIYFGLKEKKYSKQKYFCFSNFFFNTNKNFK